MPRSVMAIVLMTVVMDAVAKGMILPILPTLLQSVGDYSSAEVATALGLVFTTFSLMQFIMAPVQGALSDRWGRRPVMLFSNFALGLDCIVLALAPNFAWILIARIISGAAAGSITAANAYVVDITPPERRGAAFGLVGAAMGVGFALGPVMGGALGEVHVRLPFWVAGFLSLANGVLALFLLPESLPAARRAKLNWAQLNPLSAVWAILAKHGAIRQAFLAAFLFALASYGFSSFIVIFATYRFGWGPGELGFMMLLIGVATILVQVGLVGKAIKWFGDLRAVGYGFAVQALGLVFLGLATHPTLFLAGIVVLALSAVGESAWAGLLSRAVGDEEQGRLAGAVGAINGIGAILAPMLLAGVFALSTRYGSASYSAGSPMVVAGLMVAAGLIPAIVAGKRILSAARSRPEPAEARP
ncbi:MAG TPA: MFS transporter [Allosphingosinicella sp.]